MQDYIARRESRPTDRRAVVRYGVAVLAVAAAVMLDLWLRPTLDPEVLLLGAVLITARISGWWPALLASVLGVLALDFFFTPPLNSFAFEIALLPRLMLFMLLAVSIAAVTAAHSSAEKSLKSARNELEVRVRDRTAALERSNEQLQAEIGERQRAEDALRERADLLDLTHDSVFVRSVGDVITLWNRGAEEQYGWTRQEAIGRVSHQLLKTVFPKTLDAITEELNRTGRWEGELMHARRDGTTIAVASRWALQTDAQGTPVAVLETNNDISEHKRAEEERAQLLAREQAAHAVALGAQHRFRDLVNSLDSIVWEADVAMFMFTFVSKQAERMLGYPLEDWLNHPAFWKDRIHPDDREWAVDYCVTATAEKRDHDFEYRMLAADGRIVWVRDLVTVVVEGGQPVRLRGVMLDITARKRAEAGLRASERRHRHIFQAIGVSIWEQDFSRIKAAIDDLKAQGIQDFRQYVKAHPEFVSQAIAMVRVVDVNEATVRLFAARSKEDLLVSLDRVFTPDTYDVFAGELIAVAEGRTSFESETVLRTLQGDEVAVVVTITFPPPPSALETVLVSIMDITERKRAEDRLQQQANLLEQTHDAIVVWEFPRKIIYWNRGAERLYGFSRKEALGRATHELLQTEHPMPAHSFDAMLERDGQWSGELGHTTRDGRTIIVESQHVVTRTADGRRLVLETNRDITERKRAEQALEELAGRLIRAQEEERSRIGRELHDHISQMLGVLTIQIDQLHADPAMTPPIATALDQLRQGAIEVTDDVRRLSHRLHSSMLDYLGLAPALQKLVAEFSERFSIPMVFAHASLPTPLSSDVALALFRVTEESLTNIAKHSRARSARIAIHGAADGIHLTVEDDGNGFDVTGLTGKGGLGFVSMQERLRVLRGTVRIDSAPSRGTRIDVWVPATSLLMRAPIDEEPGEVSA